MFEKLKYCLQIYFNKDIIFLLNAFSIYTGVLSQSNNNYIQISPSYTVHIKLLKEMYFDELELYVKYGRILLGDENCNKSFLMWHLNDITWCNILLRMSFDGRNTIKDLVSRYNGQLTFFAFPLCDGTGSASISA